MPTKSEEPIDFTKDIDPDALATPPKRGRPPGSTNDPGRVLKTQAVKHMSGAVKLLHAGVGDALGDERIPVSDDEAKIVGDSLAELLESWGKLHWAKYAAPAAAAGRVYDIEAPRVKAVMEDLGQFKSPLTRGPRPTFNARVPKDRPIPPSPVPQGQDPFSVAEGDPLQ